MTKSLARPPLPVAFLHLFGLAGLAFAQPLFDLLGKNPAFFAAHGSSRWEIVGFALVVALAPPLILIVVELILGLASALAGAIAHAASVALLSSIVALQVVRRADALPTAVIFALALAIGGGVTALYLRQAGVRNFASILGAAPLLFLALFLLASPTSKIVLGGSAKAFSVNGSFRPPIVVVVFDAFPSLSFQGPTGRVDAKRFPNLSTLARDGRWYRNASNVHENTVFSVPSILDGKLPRKGQQPIVQDHPNNLFTLLGRTYQMNVAEEATNLCPPGLCRETNAKGFGARLRELADDVSVVYEYLVLPASYRKDLPQITDTWAGFRGRGAQTTPKTKKRGAKYVISHLRSGRVARWRKAVARIAGPTGGKPQLNFIHAFFPHEPRQYLPDGREYQAGAAPDPSLEGPPSYNNRFLTQQAWQRELLQAEFTDRLIGELIARLKRLGSYDDTLIVVTADHGESFAVSPKPAPPFTPGRLGFRRAITAGNAADIASIPLFIKYPTGRGPRGTDKRYARTIDVLPTLAATLGIQLPFEVDGRSLLDPSYHGHSGIYVERTFGAPLRMSASAWQSQRTASLRRRIALFGHDSQLPGLYGAGPRPDLLGQRVPTASSKPDGATILEPRRFAAVDPSSAFSPSFVAGRITSNLPFGTDVALAVNGRVAATGETFGDLGPNRLNWALLFPPAALHRGRNRVQLFAAGGNGLQLLANAP